MPPPHREKWASGFTLILQHILDAQSEEQLTRALKWFLIYPQAMLRQAKRAGKKGQGAAQVASRFQAVMDREWRRLLDTLDRDRRKERSRKIQRQQRARARQGLGSPPEDMDKKREVVLGLAARGQVGRAASRIDSNGVASLDNPTTMATLKTK